MRSTAYTDPYLQWVPVAHADGCAADGWEVRTLERTGMPPGWDTRITVQVALRAVCRTCGTSYELAADTGWIDEETGGPEGPIIDVTTRATYGHLTRPRRVREYWLHAHGERLHRDPGSGYLGYYLTRSRRAPTTPDEVLGLVWSHINRAGNTKFAAATAAVSEAGRTLYAARRAERTWDSPTGAARWIATALVDGADDHPAAGS
ncbi:hypothetical protein [Streptomonospora litoralis]|uniref:Uncharacterized protein n=1 Tax=Streptomonospora litoralis TaxID=2498135 RepID=A0A4P6Q093_9ACTN|nr:hypothetical protein [Streptomonospora litoralis]QBI53480.1 hypothetical protein EKD16_08430 [Streptomonospora litoralis]